MGSDRKRQDLIGTPTFDRSYIGRVRDMSFLGASEKEIATMFGVSTSTLQRWRKDNPEFKAAWEEGRDEADAKVAAAFYKRAVGYSYVSSRRIDDKGEVHENITHVKPDVNAATKWLAVRQPDKWGKLLTGGQQGFGPEGSAAVGAALMNDTEVARRVCFLLAKAVQDNNDKSVTIDGSLDHDSDGTNSSETK